MNAMGKYLSEMKAFINNFKQKFADSQKTNSSIIKEGKEL